MGVPQNLPPPSRNPAFDDSLPGVFEVVLRKFLQNLDDMLPASVVAYDATANRVQVQPVISAVLTDGTILARAPLLSIPVQQIGGGGFVLRFPIKPGDLGFVKSNDRDISLFLQSLQTAVPNTARLHSFSDAVFLPMALAAITIGSGDSASVSLQTVNGLVRLSVGTMGALISNQAGYSANPGAVLDVQSTSGAFKFPAMTTGQKNAIVSPVPGFAVYDTTLDRLSVYSAASGWS